MKGSCHACGFTGRVFVPRGGDGSQYNIVAHDSRRKGDPHLRHVGYWAIVTDPHYIGASGVEDAMAASRPGDAHAALDEGGARALRERLDNPGPNPAAAEALQKARHTFGGNVASKGHHFCKAGSGEYGTCCHCGEERAYRPLLNYWCPAPIGKGGTKHQEVNRQ